MLSSRAGIHYVYGLAVDPAENKLYVSNFHYNKVEMFDLVASNTKTIANTTNPPRGLAADLQNR